MTSELVEVLRAPLLLEGALESTLETWREKVWGDWFYDLMLKDVESEEFFFLFFCLPMFGGLTKVY